MSSLALPESVTRELEEQQVSSLAKNIIEVLDKHYPTYTGTWHILINTDPNAGVVQVRNLRISGTMGFQIPITWLHDHDTMMKLIKNNGGELLERFRLSRERGASVEDQLNDAKRNFKGELIHDE